MFCKIWTIISVVEISGISIYISWFEFIWYLCDDKTSSLWRRRWMHIRINLRDAAFREVSSATHSPCRPMYMQLGCKHHAPFIGEIFSCRETRESEYISLFWNESKKSLVHFISIYCFTIYLRLIKWKRDEEEIYQYNCHYYIYIYILFLYFYNKFAIFYLIYFTFYLI